MMNDLKCVNTLSNSGMALSRRVSFPKSDDELVTGYLEPANPWEHVCIIKSIPEIAELYVTSCQKHNTEPLPYVLDHLKIVDLQNHLRQPLLSLKSIKLAHSDCEALEEIFKRIQYKTIDLSNCGLNETAASALFEIIEYYEATNELDISSNAKGMTHRGWASCNYMIGHSQELFILNAEGNPISKLSADNLGSALGTSNLHTLKLEHCGLRGLPLFNLCFKLRHNRILKELWLGHNDLDCHDADTIADLLKANHYLELIDISNNNIRDEGLRHIVVALIMQSKELERRKTLQRAFALDKYGKEEVSSSTLDNDILPASEMSLVWNNKSNNDEIEAKDDMKNINEKNGKVEKEEKEGMKQELLDNETNLRIKDIQEEYDIKFSKSDVDMTNKDENTIENVQSKTIRINQNFGQSMLDKLLSMNSESSSEDRTLSIQSIDTLSTSCSEDGDKQEEEFSILSPPAISLTSCITKVIPTYSLPTKTFDTLIKTRATENTTKMETLSDITKKLHTSTNLSFNENTNNITLINISNNSNSCCSRSKSPLNFDSQSTTLKVADEVEETKTHTLCSNSCKIDTNICCTKIVDVSKSTKLGDDFDDSHSTDSAFESASEGDISRHLPDELLRLSDSLDIMKFENCDKEFTNETITSTSLTAFNNSKYVIAPSTNSTSPSQLPAEVFFENVPSSTDFSHNTTVIENNSCLFDSSKSTAASNIGMPISIVFDENSTTLTSTLDCCSKEPESKNSKDNIPHCKLEKKNRSGNEFATMGNSKCKNSGYNAIHRRTDSSCTFLTQSSRTYSQSTDSLCSDNSLDGSTGSADSTYTSSQLNEKLTKNDTLTRQQRQINTTTERFHRAPSGLKVLSVWNNNITKESAVSISDLLSDTISLELLNIGKNCLSNDFLIVIKDSLIKNTTLNTIGLQSAHLSSKGIETLASILNFGGNSFLQRIDIRDNIVEVESLLSLAEVLKSNTMIIQIDIDDEPKRLSVGSEAHSIYSRALENVRSMCLRNEKSQMLIQTEKSTSNANKKRIGYYIGSRKISLTCHGRPIIDKVNKNGENIQRHQSSNKLEVKRKSGTRLRSPVPSPPSISPSSSPNRTNRFQVFRVAEISPSTSLKTASTNNVKTVTECINSKPVGSTNTLPLSSSLPSIPLVSSTQSIKRLGASSRSRFHVKRIYEDSIPPLHHRPVSSVTTASTSSIPFSVSIVQNHFTADNSNNEIFNNHNQNREVIKSITDENIPTSTSKDMPPVIASLLELDSNRKISANLIPHDHKTNIIVTTSCNNSMQAYDNIEKATLDLTPITTETISKKSLGHLRCSSFSSLPLLSPSASLSSLPNNNETSSEVPFERKRLLDVATLGQCPLAMFSENDITLTKNTLPNFNVSTKESTIPIIKCGENSRTNCSTSLNNIDNVVPTISMQQRTRKISLLSNTTAVDKLLTLFHHPETLFQRYSTAIVTTATTPTITMSTSAFPCTSESETVFDLKNDITNQPAQQEKIVEPNQSIHTQQDNQYSNQAIKLFKVSSPPSLAKLCGNRLNTTAVTTADVAAATGALAAVTNVTKICKDNSIIESSNNVLERSKQLLLETASKQLHDFSKHLNNIKLSQMIDSISLDQNHRINFSILDEQLKGLNNNKQVQIGNDASRAFNIESVQECDIKFKKPTDVNSTDDENLERKAEEETNCVQIFSTTVKCNAEATTTVAAITTTEAAAAIETIIITTTAEASTTDTTTNISTAVVSISKCERSDSTPTINVDNNIKGNDNDINKESQ